MKEHRKLVAPLCIAIIASFVAIQTARDVARAAGGSSAPPPPPCSDAERALLGGLDAGQDLGDFRVKLVRCGKPGVVEIDVARGESSLVLVVADRGALPYDPPKQTGAHDLFYNRRGPKGVASADGEIDALLGHLADRVLAAEKKTGSAAPEP